MITIERAILIAIGAHSGQKDLEGRPEILHPLRVGLMGETREKYKRILAVVMNGLPRILI